MDALLIVFLILLNGLFAMSEMALASSRKARLAALEEAGDKGAAVAMALLEQPTQFLSTVQVGITSIGVLNGIVGEAAFSARLAQYLMAQGLGESAAALSATAVVVTLITFATIIFGELVPKRIGQLYPETVARLVARPMTWVATGAKPFVRLLSVSTQGVLKLLRIDNSAGRSVTVAAGRYSSTALSRGVMPLPVAPEIGKTLATPAARSSLLKARTSSVSIRSILLSATSRGLSSSPAP